MKRKVFLAAILVFMASTASAIDINSTTSLRYFPDSNMEFRVDTSGNALFKGGVNISGSNGQIASFESNQITMNQPLSIESSGPLSVENGIDLTGTSTNTIDSYSSLYLKTSSGSPTDIVLEPTGVTDIDSNATVRGNLGVGGSQGFSGIGMERKVEIRGDDTGLILNSGSPSAGNDFANVIWAAGGNAKFYSGYDGKENQWRLVDQTTGKEVLVSSEGSNDVALPNGNLNVKDNHITSADTISSPPEASKIHLGNTGLSLSNEDGDIALETDDKGEFEVLDGGQNLFTINDGVAVNKRDLMFPDSNDIQANGADAIQLDSNQNVKIPSGSLHLDGSGVENGYPLKFSADNGRTAAIYVEDDTCCGGPGLILRSDGTKAI
ncbi:MAG: hypothetical protein ABEJ72_05540, partial [Candidatus Aenigmatarchaeota archaeon]